MQTSSCKQISRRMKPCPRQSKRTLAADSCPPCDTGRKIGAVEMALVWNLLHEDPACPSRVLDKSAQRQVPIAVSVRHVNRLRVRWHLNRRKGRPRQAARSTPVASDRAVVQVTPRLSFVGVHLLAHWLDQHDGFAPVVARLQHAIEAYKRTSRRGLCLAASSRADATAALSGPVFCPAARDRNTDRVRYA